MTQNEVLAMLHKVVAENQQYTTWTVSTPHLVALVNQAIEKEREEFAAHAVDIARQAVAEEREAIAKMFEYAPALVEFARNDRGGCVMCGFTPEWVVASIRARGKA